MAVNNTMTKAPAGTMTGSTSGGSSNVGTAPASSGGAGANPGSSTGTMVPVTPPVTTPPVTTPPPTTTPGDGLDATQRNAYQVLKDLFHQYDLDTLAPDILKYLQNGYTQDTITTMLQESDAYKQRFAGNEARIKNGLSVLSPAQYLSTEAGYRQVLQSYGLPKGFYDQHSDFSGWIGSDVSVNEINTRAQMASDAVTNSDPNYVAALQQMGLSQGDMVANMLDQKRALPVIQKIVNASKIGQSALDQGLKFDNNRVSQWADNGTTQAQAQQAYGQVAAALPAAGALSEIYKQNYGQTDLEDELLGNNGLASQRRKQLGNAEAAAFAGSSGGTKSTGRETRGGF